MPKNKFRFILKFIQLDNKTSCHKRWKRDKFGAIWILYEEVNVQNAKNKTSSTYTSIDERLYLYCGEKKSNKTLLSQLNMDFWTFVQKLRDVQVMYGNSASHKLWQKSPYLAD